MKVVSDIKIRNINAATLARIDQKAKASGMSRNRYLLKQLDYISVTEPLKEIKEDIDLTLSAITDLLLQQQKELIEIKQTLARLEEYK